MCKYGGSLYETIEDYLLRIVYVTPSLNRLCHPE